AMAGASLIDAFGGRGEPHDRHVGVRDISVSLAEFDAAHLLAEDLHGPFTNWNAAFTARTLNEQMKGKETVAHGKITDTSSPKRLKYEVTASYFNNQRPPVNFEAALANVPESSQITTLTQWLGFYTAENYHLTASEWDDVANAYSAPYFSGDIQGAI